MVSSPRLLTIAVIRSFCNMVGIYPQSNTLTSEVVSDRWPYFLWPMQWSTPSILNHFSTLSSVPQKLCSDSPSMKSAHGHYYTPLGEDEDTPGSFPQTRRKMFQVHVESALFKWLGYLLLNLLALALIWKYDRHTTGQSCGLQSDVLFGQSKSDQAINYRPDAHHHISSSSLDGSRHRQR